MVQINTGNELQKSGINPNEVDDFIKLCKKDYGLNVTGLMCIPPAESPSNVFFEEMVSIKNKLNNKLILKIILLKILNLCVRKSYQIQISNLLFISPLCFCLIENY